MSPILVNWCRNKVALDIVNFKYNQGKTLLSLYVSQVSESVDSEANVINAAGHGPQKFKRNHIFLKQAEIPKENVHPLN